MFRYCIKSKKLANPKSQITLTQFLALWNCLRELLIRNVLKLAIEPVEIFSGPAARDKKNATEHAFVVSYSLSIKKLFSHCRTWKAFQGLLWCVQLELWMMWRSSLDIEKLLQAKLARKAFQSFSLIGEALALQFDVFGSESDGLKWTFHLIRLQIVHFSSSVFEVGEVDRKLK